MVYDQAHRVVLLYGGVDTHGGTIPCGVDVGNRSCSADTWTWDGTNWNQLHPSTSPSPFFPSIAYDATSASVILHAISPATCAGSACSDGAGTDLTWVWDGSGWSRRSGAGDPSTVGVTPVMTYDPGSGHVLIFGGHSYGGGDTHQMWGWNGRAWTVLNVRSPLADLGNAASSDATHHVVIAYQSPTQSATGGTNADAQTWTWDGSRWNRMAPTVQPAVYLPALFDDPRGHRVLLVGVNLTKLLEIWAWNGSEWSPLV